MSAGFPAAAPAAPGALPPSLQRNPLLGSWLRFAPEGHVDVYSGKVELGQGILTALAQIVAEELDLRIDQVRMHAAGTAASPDEAVTSGSLSIQESGAALRQACAEARAIYLQAAALQLGVGADRLLVDGGEIHCGDGRSTSYWALADAPLLQRAADGQARPKDAAAYRLVGQAVPRIDLAGKVFGRAGFIHDLEFPGMLHGRMLRPPAPGAVLEALDDSAARACPGVFAVVRDGSLLGLLAATPAQAERALARLAEGAAWSEGSALPDQHAMPAWLKAQPADSTIVDRRTCRQDGSHDSRQDSLLPGTAAPVRTLRASYAKPYLAHGSIGPSCALARIDGERLLVWTHSQGIFNLRRDLGLALHIDAAHIDVQHVPGAGCYGHNGADDVAFDAAWLARAAGGRPVRVQWSRADELRWAPLAPAMAVDLEADLGEDGEVTGWRHAVWSNGHSLRPGRASTPALLGCWHRARPSAPLVAINAPLAAGGGAERNAVPLYDFPAWDIVSHRVLTMPLRTSAMRALGAVANVFAIESFIDELAHASGIEPAAFRLRHLRDARARAVIERVLEKSRWSERPQQEGRGRGLGFARYKNSGAYCAVVADVLAEAELRVLRLTICVDVGRVINPDGVANQVEGGAIQAVSWALKEAVRFDAGGIGSDSWESYPILRFPEIPEVDVDIVASGLPSVGAGEASLGPTVAALGNALFDALGVRVRELPLTAERIVAAFE